MVEKIQWNENGPRVTRSRPLVVCDTKRFAREAENGPLLDRNVRARSKKVSMSCNWFKKYASDQREHTLGLGYSRMERVRARGEEVRALRDK